MSSSSEAMVNIDPSFRTSLPLFVCTQGMVWVFSTLLASAGVMKNHDECSMALLLARRWMQFEFVSVIIALTDPSC